jgi:hypothetical protein
MGASGDTLWVYDINRRRLTFFDARSGAFRTTSMAATAALPSLVGRRADGSFVFASDVLPADLGSLTSGFSRPDAVYFRVDADGAIGDTLLIGKGQERIVQISGPERIELFRPLFSRAASRTVLGDDLVYGDQVGFEAHVYRRDGSLRRIVRRTGIDLQLTDQSYRDLEETLVSSAPANVQPGLRQLYDKQAHPTTRPAFNRFLPGPDGELWVQDWTFDGAATGWSVFGADGAWLGSVQMPARFWPFTIGRDEILGVWRDELDVEFVRAYPLQRGR